MYCGYKEIDITVLFTLDGNDKGLRGHIVRKFVNQDLTRMLGTIFSQIESLTDGTVWTLDQDTVDAPSLNFF